MVSGLLRGEPQLGLRSDRLFDAVGLAGRTRTVAYFHSSGSDTNAFAERLITHLKLNGATASLVQDTFGSASANKLAATITVVISFLVWGIGIGADLPGASTPAPGG